jgi:hypothetical protein
MEFLELSVADPSAPVQQREHRLFWAFNDNGCHYTIWHEGLCESKPKWEVSRIPFTTSMKDHSSVFKNFVELAEKEYSGDGSSTAVLTITCQFDDSDRGNSRKKKTFVWKNFVESDLRRKSGVCGQVQALIDLLVSFDNPNKSKNTW